MRGHLLPIKKSTWSLETEMWITGSSLHTPEIYMWREQLNLYTITSLVTYLLALTFIKI